MYGHYGTTAGGRKNACSIALFYLYGAIVFAGNLLPNGKRVLAFQVAKLRDRRPAWFREDAAVLLAVSYATCRAVNARRSLKARFVDRLVQREAYGLSGR